VERLLAFSKLKKIKISLDGATARTNDAIRHQGNFKKVIRNLSFIKKKNRFEIILMFTVMKRNFRDLLSFIHLCEDSGVDGLILERFIPWGRGRGIIDEVLEKEQWKELVETLLEYFSTKTEEDSLCPLQAFQVIFRGDEAELMGAPCVVGRDGLCIMPDGRVLPCRRFPISIGNLLENSLDLIWEKSELLGDLRKKENLKGKCGRCEIRDCRGCRSLTLSLTGDYLEEDPHCWYQPETLPTHWS
jgi:radical SAM protein with 4Fe4S-binding SPASM domain